MKRVRALIVTALAVAAVVSMAGVVGSAQTVSATTRVTTNITVQTVGLGAIDWTNGVIQVKASGVGDPSKPMAQRKLLARRAAVVSGYRELLETTKGVLVQSETLMRDFMVVNDDVRAAAEGIVNNAVVVPGSETYQEESDGSITCTLTMEMLLRDILVPVYSTMRHEFGTAVVTTTTVPSPYTGLIIDVSGLAFPKPAVFRVVTVGGTVVYGISVAKYEYACQSRLASYINSVIAAKQNLQDRVGANPYVVKAVRIVGTDIIVPQEVVTVTTSMTTVLQECRVVVAY
ncbi:MAG: hypothetical protein NUW12_00050 [Firmicutes bacterium]|jgi:hypothetical protein|nr:hypothetical protein [Bacillota bacterium]MDH7494341.1 hypothetical protein [Bacillota bacterium]